MFASANERLRTVWVLGAGFSRSLGGPLLPELLRQAELVDLLAKYPPTEFPGLAQDCFRAQTVYNYARKIEGLWKNAEEFLEFVDSAEHDRSASKSLRRIADTAFPLTEQGTPRSSIQAAANGMSVTDLREAARRAVAAECAWFALASQPLEERWQPYRSWAASLSAAHDTIICMNYDPVVELAAAPETIWPILPHEHPGPANTRVPLLKLHGSVTWCRESSGCKLSDADNMLKAPSNFLVIGTPGRSKRELKDGLLEPLWQKAEKALHQAHVVIFVGYRFPESDADARRRLLGALVENSQNVLRLRLVLGTNRQAPDTVRLQRLLEVSCRRGRRSVVDQMLSPGGHRSDPAYDLRVEPLMAEDFLALYADRGPLSTAD